MLTSALKKNSEEDTLPLSLEFSDPSTIKSKNKGRPPKKGKQRKRLNTTTAAADFEESPRVLNSNTVLNLQLYCFFILNTTLKCNLELGRIVIYYR